jgi:hypothetical protein
MSMDFGPRENKLVVGSGMARNGRVVTPFYTVGGWEGRRMGGNSLGASFRRPTVFKGEKWGEACSMQKVSRRLEAAASVCPEVGHDDGSGPGGPRGPNGRKAMVGQFQIKNKINKTKPVGFHRVWG